MIKSLGTIVGFVTLAYVSAANFIPQSALGNLILEAGDRLINADRLSNIYVYFESDENGELREEGDLVPVGNEPSVPYWQVEVGDVFFVRSTVHIRPAPTTNSDVVDQLGAGECVVVISADFPLSFPQARDTARGGWLNVSRELCV